VVGDWGPAKKEIQRKQSNNQRANTRIRKDGVLTKVDKSVVLKTQYEHMKIGNVIPVDATK
jgi:hypothetical protein